MLIILESVRFTINMPVGIIVLLSVIALIWCILFFLYYRFSHFRNKVYFNLDSTKNAEIPGKKELEQQMHNLAMKHTQVKLMKYNFVLDDYNQIAYKKLNKIRNNISEISTDIISLIPAARWLFDNYQMMYREIKKVRASGTSYEILPILKSKEFRGFPRIYIIAKKMVALSGGHLNEDNINVMLKAYQNEITLTDKELWVLPEMLGFCLLENIIEAAEDILGIIDLKSRADKFVKEKLGAQQKLPDISSLLVEMDLNCKSNFSFHSHVIYLLKSMSYDEVTIQSYIDYHFNDCGKQLKPSKVYLEEGRIESSLETNIRALIVSLREINEIDVESFYEEYSYLEQVLSKDPEGIYPRMDSESKGMYRSVIVKFALDYRLEEQKIVNDCLELAIQGREELYHSHHVGTYLLGKGYSVLKAKVLNKPRYEKAKVDNKKGFYYFFLLFTLLFVIGYFLTFFMLQAGLRNEMDRIGIVLFLAFPLLLGIATEITNFIFTRRIKVKKIPSLDYLTDIPDSARTFVVMPVIVSSKEQGLEYFERLQKHYLANRQSNLYFGLLIDYKDSPEQYSQEDEVIENALIGRMKELNECYPSIYQRFSLFVRYRKWNKSENCYMGWERKRGKLEEFNNLLNGSGQEATSFSLISCDKELLGTFKYVITLDADTNLIRDNAAKLVGLIDHPLNQPILDSDSGKVKEGYVIIQPSVRNHIVDRKGSRFAEIFGGQSGLDHYSAVISDIYQDIFNQGIYTGKGIYDAKAFHRLLHNVIPENKVLSHDLLESCFARTAFSSAAKIMDSFPSSFISYAKREHRWIRGDWQLLPWLFMRNAQNGKPFCALSRWKILDNLRRSMVPLSKTLLIIVNLALIPHAFYLWVPLVFFNDIFNIAVFLIAIISQKLFRSKLALVYRGLMKELRLMLQRGFVEFALTPYRAYIATDAMLRTLYRLFISNRNLLRWNTAESVDASVQNTKRGYFRTMWISLLPAGVVFGLLLFENIHLWGILLYAAVAVSWVMAYAIAFHISQPKESASKLEQSQEDKELLMLTARRTWQFFKELSTKDNNWLCPDNYQTALTPKLSDKTSPTNIGLQFLAIISARDFGFETLSNTIESTENLMGTVQKLLKWKGHLYNWYHIKTLEVLSPAYISTVDSGNYIGHLIALKNALLEQRNKPILTDSLITELRYNLQQIDCKATLMDSYRTIGEIIEYIKDIWEELDCRDAAQDENDCICKKLLKSIEAIVKEAADYKLKEYSFSTCPTLAQAAQRDNKNAKLMLGRINELCSKIDNILANVEFGFLFDFKRLLFHIGYHVSSGTLDAGCYDLMASESSLTSFLAIARGEVPLKHWNKLGRPLTMIKGIPCFVSWSGTMFEYLMPNLVLREYVDSVYAETAKAAVRQQILYADEAGIPWGISESQYYRFDLNSNYQYKAFGVPKLRLQPVRKNSLVATPYATMLALEYAGEECFSNLRKLVEYGAFGAYGFYEAIDYNNPNSVDMTPYCIVKSFMAHHQGMILVAINNYLNQGIMRTRFHTEPIVKATEVLLEEKRQSHLISLAKRGYTIRIGKLQYREEDYNNRYVNSVAPKIPIANYLSNNKYSLMITSDGDGFSMYNNLMLYRWRADMYANTGNYIYIKDITKGKLWSAAYHPTKTEPEEYQVIFSPYQAEFKRRDGDISSQLLVSLSPNHNLEIRKLNITNHARESRQFEVTSFLEVVDDTHLAELSHPAFNKLFIESEFLEEQSVFLSKRRGNKSSGNPYIMHMVKTDAKLQKDIEYENDRLKFIGRNNTLQNPEAIVNSLQFSNRSGFCNDPIMSMRVNVSIGVGETVGITFITGVCSSKEEAIKINEELNPAYRIDDMCEKFRMQRDIELKYLEITNSQLNAFQDLISPIFYPNKLYRGLQENIRRNSKNQSFLWKFGISGDNPILLLRVASINEAEIIKDVLKAYEYLRINRIVVDLVILSEAKHGYMQELDDLVNDLTSSLRIYEAGNDKPSFFMLHSYQMLPAEIDLLFTVARVVFTEKTGIYFRNIKERQQELIEE